MPDNTERIRALLRPYRIRAWRGDGDTIHLTCAGRSADIAWRYGDPNAEHDPAAIVDWLMAHSETYHCAPDIATFTRWWYAGRPLPLGQAEQTYADFRGLYETLLELFGERAYLHLSAYTVDDIAWVDKLTAELVPSI